MIKVTSGGLPGLLKLEPAVHHDERGFFLEGYNEREFTQATGITERFVQDNHSHSLRNVIRGLHYQVRRPQGKLLRVLSGEIYDVVVDVRKSSPTKGQWQAVALCASDGLMLWIPAGYAHGFLVTSERADVLYKTTDFRYPAYERSLAWNDPDVGVRWPITGAPILSRHDAGACSLRNAELLE